MGLAPPNMRLKLPALTSREELRWLAAQLPLPLRRLAPAGPAPAA